MTPEDLKSARQKLGIDKQTTMAQLLRTPYRTYQDWEAGKRRIPGVCEVAVELLLAKDQWVMAKIKAKMERLMDE